MRVKRAALFFLFSFLFVSCATNNSRFADVERSAIAADYAGARQRLEKEKKSLYGNSDKVLYLLDSGLLAHYAQEFPQSNTLLSDAEKQIFDYYAKSVSQAVGSVIINDTVIDYSGEDYEDVYTNIFMALNYIHQNNIEAAMVEIRRFDTKLKALSVKYRDQILQAQKASEQSEPIPEIQFTNSAFARYLSMILYRSQGEMSPAEVDLRFIKSAFKSQPQLYDFPLPAQLDDELFFPPDKARLNLVAFTGFAPIKEQQVLRLPFHSTYFKLALPIMTKRPSVAESVTVSVCNERGEQANITLSLLESIENIVIDTFKQHHSLIYFKTFARATAKAVTSGALGAASDVSRGQGDANASLIFSLLDLGSRIFTEATEQADTRISRFFPARVYAGGITLDPGTYSIVVSYHNAQGKVLYTDQRDNVTVVSGRSLNFTESYFLH